MTERADPMQQKWLQRAAKFLHGLEDPASSGSRSVPDGPITLYGTCYAALAKSYIGLDAALPQPTRQFILDCQDAQTGLLIGPELKGYFPDNSASHDREHLALHLTCTALATCQHFQ